MTDIRRKNKSKKWNERKNGSDLTMIEWKQQLVKMKNGLIHVTLAKWTEALNGQRNTSNWIRVKEDGMLIDEKCACILQEKNATVHTFNAMHALCNSSKERYHCKGWMLSAFTIKRCWPWNFTRKYCIQQQQRNFIFCTNGLLTV